MTYSIIISLRRSSKDVKDEQKLIRPKGSEGAFQAERTAGTRACQKEARYVLDPVKKSSETERERAEGGGERRDHKGLCRPH